MYLSLIIPTYNRSHYLKYCLQSLIKQTLLSKYYEILVIDNGSTDDTKALVAHFQNKYRLFKIFYIYEPIPGLLSGRHRGANEAKGDILVFLDDDIIASPNCFKEIFNAFKNPKVNILVGRYLPKYEVKPPWWEKHLWDINKNNKTCGHYSLADYGEKACWISPLLTWGLLYPIRKDTFVRHGGFNPDCIPKKIQYFQGDGEGGLGMKIELAGEKALYVPEAEVYHWVTKSRMTINYLKERAFYQGVCDSYTDIRQHNPYKIISYRKDVYDTFIDMLFQLVLIVKNFKSLRTNFIKKCLNLILKRSYNYGYLYHSNHVKSCPKLLKWVRKTDYFDYRLPKI